MLTHSFLLASLVVGYSRAIDLDTSNNGSIKAAAQIVASNILEFYPNNPNGTAPGIASQPGADAPIGTFDSPYYWWEAGAVWNGLLDYWAVTGDAQYNSLVMQALLFQTGPNFDYMPTNQSKSEGNDDQGVWALAALTAAELALPMAASSHVSWTDLAVTVFNDQVKRWDTTTCSGGLRWQIFAFNAGYNYKNSMSQGTFFQLAARLAVLTGNSTYADWATKVWDWTSDVGMLESGTKGTMLVYDGTVDTANCTQIDKLQWSMSTGLFLEGSVAMWQFTNSTTWSDRTTALLSTAESTFALPPWSCSSSNSAADSTCADQKTLLVESACQVDETCNTDQRAYRYYLARALASVAAAGLGDEATTLLTASAEGAATVGCVGTQSIGSTGCGINWGTAATNGTQYGGVGDELSALGVIVGLGRAKGLAAVSAGSGGGAAGTGANTTAPSSSSSAAGPTASTSGSAELGSGNWMSNPLRGWIMAIGVMVTALAMT